MAIRWYGLVAPEEAATGDRRMFAGNGLTNREFPLPAAWQRVSGSGHQGSVVVASWDRRYPGDGGVWGAGQFLDPAIVPEVTEAIYLLEKGLIGPSVDLDPDFAYEVVAHPDRPDEFAMKVTRGNVHGVTFVMGPAFPQVHITVDTEQEMTVLASAGITCATFAVNSRTWNRFPLAPRETPFDADTAIANIAAWSGGDATKFGQGFLWKDDKGNPLNRESYRLPIIDILDGKPYLIPRAVFSAGVIMSGGHGGLYDTLDQAERLKVQEVITDIYDMLRQEYGDPRVTAPWQKGGREGARNEEDTPTRVASLETEEFQMIIDLAMASPEFQSRLGGELEEYWVRGEGAAKIRWGTEGSFDRCVRALRDKFPKDTEGLCANLHHEATGKWPAEGKKRGEHSLDGEDGTFAVRSSGWSSMPISTAAWDEGAARRALDSWAGDDMGKYGRAFLWSDGSGNRTGFKFPIAKPVDGTLTVFIRAVNNAEARLNQADIPSADKSRIEGILNAIQKRHSGGNEAGFAMDGMDHEEGKCPEGKHMMPDGTCMDDEDMPDMEGMDDYAGDSVTAAGVLKPSAAWFEDPKLPRGTFITITDEGRVYARVAEWKTCHLGIGNRCVMAPRSATNYKFFKTGSVITSEGKTIRIGKITLGTGHADDKYGVIPATEHYDNTGTCVAVVNVGEDEYGIWAAGALVADTSPEKVAELRRSPLSGDWRRVNGNLELVAALAVNDPGFPIVHDDDQGIYSMVAAGVVRLDEPTEDSGIFAGVDTFLTDMARADRADSINRAFQDLLPPEEGCDCHL